MNQATETSSALAAIQARNPVTPVTAAAVRVKYLDHPGLVTAYIGDGDPYAMDTGPGEAPTTIILATATRYTKREGYDYTGWVVDSFSGRHENGERIKRKPDALELLKSVAERELPLLADSLARE